MGRGILAAALAPLVAAAAANATGVVEGFADCSALAAVRAAQANATAACAAAASAPATACDGGPANATAACAPNATAAAAVTAPAPSAALNGTEVFPRCAADASGSCKTAVQTWWALLVAARHARGCAIDHGYRAAQRCSARMHGASGLQPWEACSTAADGSDRQHWSNVVARCSLGPSAEVMYRYGEVTCAKIESSACGDSLEAWWQHLLAVQGLTRCREDATFRSAKDCARLSAEKRQTKRSDVGFSVALGIGIVFIISSLVACVVFVRHVLSSDKNKAHMNRIVAAHFDAPLHRLQSAASPPPPPPSSVLSTPRQPLSGGTSPQFFETPRHLTPLTPPPAQPWSARLPPTEENDGGGRHSTSSFGTAPSEADEWPQ